jgi:hypothetical protein
VKAQKWHLKHAACHTVGDEVQVESGWGFKFGDEL